MCVGSCISIRLHLRLCVFDMSARGGAGGRARVVAFGAIGRARALAAGITWTSRTLAAGWAARAQHTSVVDAAGAIYVIGGVGGGTDFQDVWASTDGCARAGLALGLVGGVLVGTQGGS
jgi:hypothetical protein